MANINPINKVPFGQERTAKEHRDRSEWERDQAAQLRAQKQPVGYEHIAQGHEDAARSYEKRASEIQGDMVTTARRGEARGKSRAELVDVARAAAAAVFAPRKVSPSEAALKKARSAAFKAIQRHDRLAGTADHPVAAYAHGIAELAAEATEEARQRWEMHHDRLRTLRGKSGGRSHSTISRDDAHHPTAEARRQAQTIRRREEFPEILAISMRADGTNYQVKVPDTKNKRGYDLVDVLIHDNGMRSIKSVSRSVVTPTKASKIVSRYLEATR